jgi:23S rRNA (uracil1939-C5)-methyltransferase
MKHPEFLPGLEPTDISTDGRAVARHEGKVVFIEGAIPGDTVDVWVKKKKPAYMEAQSAGVTRLSPHRVTPVCEHFGYCGGCKWQHMTYEAQLRHKEKFVREAIERIGKAEVREFLPIVASEEKYYYRNKLEFTFSDKRWLTPEEMKGGEIIGDRRGLGYHIHGMFDKILDIRNCYLQPEPSNSIRNAVKDYAATNGLTFFDIRKKSGFLRTLMIRNTLAGELMVLVAVYEWQEPELFTLLAHLREQFPRITSLLYAHNHKANDTLDGIQIKVFSGEDHITEEMEGLRFRISAKSFYQTNPAQAYRLYCLARSFAELSGTEHVYDLYTGTGTIANFLARNCRRVTGIEYVEDSVKDARANAVANNIANAAFHSGDMKDLLTESFFATQGKPDVIITDPPRAGMHEDVVKAIVRAAPERVVYVSCNPGTQARDISLMSESYEVVKVQPVDMFPQTTHVESVALLRKRRGA